MGAASWENKEVVFDRMAPDGRAMGLSGTRPFFAYGVIPGERALVRPLKRRGGATYAEVIEILTPSPARIVPREEHCLSCSPWQIANYESQTAFKKQALENAFAALPGTPPVGVDEFIESPQDALFGYRTKIEFSFTEVDGTLSLAFFGRAQQGRKIPLSEGCALASPAANAAAFAVLQKLRDAHIPAHALKTLMLRESKFSGNIIAALYVTTRDFPAASVAETKELAGLHIIYSDPSSPASVTSDILFQCEESSLEERVGTLRLRYPFDAFFQNNIPLFERALAALQTHVEGIKPKRITELYSGAGTIGLAIAGTADEILGMEIVPAAVELANRNAEANGITNYHAECVAAEHIPPDRLGTDVLILDPPRAGLHPKVVRHILEAHPAHILYLSCNFQTQAADYAKLATIYHATHLTDFDFYPNTPHMESLLALTL